MAANLYFLWGEEAFLIDREIEKIIAQVSREAGEDPEVVYIDADGLSPEGLLEMLEFSPLFSLQRVVVIKRPQWLRKAVRKQTEFEQAFKNYLNYQPAGQTVVITSDEHSTSNPMVKLLDKQAVVIRCKAPESQQLAKWIKDEFAARNHRVSPAAVNLLARSGQDMYYLQNLIEKICLMTEAKVEVEDIENQLDSKVEIKVFKLTDALLKRDVKEALGSFYQLLDQGGHPIFFLYMIVRQFITMGKVKDGAESGLDNKTIADNIGIKEFAVRKMSGYARNFTWGEIRWLFQRFLEVDIKFKSTGQDQKIIMEALITEICIK